jgi:hypothetical protein
MSKLEAQPNASEIRFAFLFGSVGGVAALSTLVGFAGVIIWCDRFLSGETGWGLILLPLTALLFGVVVFALVVRRILHLGDWSPINKVSPVEHLFGTYADRRAAKHKRSDATRRLGV